MMNKCKDCPFQYIDYGGNQKCRIDSKIVNAYGCERDLSVEKLRYEKESDLVSWLKEE